MSENKEAVTKADKVKNKKPNIFKRMGRGIKRFVLNIVQELKKVTWPTFPKVVKQTAVVLGVVLVFLVCVTCFDLGLGAVLQLVTGRA